MRLRLRILGQLLLVALGAVAIARWAHTCGPPAQPERVIEMASPRPLVEADWAIERSPEPEPLALATIPETVAAPAGEVEAADLVRRWSQDRGLALTIDPQVLQTKLAFARPATLDAESLRELLDAHDLVLVRGRAATLHLVHRRNLATKFGPPWDEVAGAEPVDPDRIVTRTVTVRHGSGNNIFATLRGFSARDMNRISNLLYIPGAEQIVMVDFARNVRYWEQLIRTMDVPGPDAVRKRFTVLAWRLDAASWDGIRSLDGRDQVARLEALVREGGAESAGLLVLAAPGSDGSRKGGGRLVAGDARIEVAIQGQAVEVEVGARAEERKDRVTLNYWLPSADGPLVQAATDPADADRRLVVALIP